MRNQNVVSKSFNERTKWVTLSKNRYANLKLTRPLAIISGFRIPFIEFNGDFDNSSIVYFYIQLTLSYYVRTIQNNLETTEYIDLNLRVDTTLYDFMSSFYLLTRTAKSYTLPYIKGNYYGFENSNYFLKNNVDSYHVIPKSSHHC